jgi:2-polyprenyl-6-hydroxyphenyl methylase/3-demethylubiquinone-9 3-methyltransferase
MSAPASWSDEVAGGERFEFGANWAAFLSRLDENRIQTAEASLKEMLELDRLDGMTFLDVGSGSGLFSLAARRLGARVTSFDFDPKSVACTSELKQRYFEGDALWTIGTGSILDRDFVAGLPKSDIVYSWGVLHHTGEMWKAIENALNLVAPSGMLYISIYNDQGGASRRWTKIKRLYVKTPRHLRWAILLPAFGRLWGPTFVRDTLKRRPTSTWRSRRARGMDPWRDLIDWVGGYPFEVAKPEEVFDFCTERGFRLRKLKTCGGGLGCNEFVFVRADGK